MKKEFFIKNRDKLFNHIEDNSVVILVAGSANWDSEDEYAKFSPNRNFYYMSGIDEESDIVILSKINGKREERVFIPRFNPALSRWVGKTYSKEEIEEKGGFKEIYYLDELEEKLGTFYDFKNLKIYMDFNAKKDDKYFHLASKDFADKYLNGYEINDIYSYIAGFRLYKEPEEIEEIRRAIHITNIALEEVKKQVKDNQEERVLDSLFGYHIFVNGASDFAFRTICASGAHSCTLHYMDNNDVMHDGDLVLFDLGAASNYYRADISRTFAVSGKMSDRQKQMYELVRSAQELIFKNAKPGLTTRKLNQMVVEYYQDKLMEIGLIDKKEDVSKYYFHGVSHHLGLDTHDVALLKTADIELKPGCVITVEPGIYIEEERIGIRIEDDVLITENGCEVLSTEIAK